MNTLYGGTHNSPQDPDVLIYNGDTVSIYNLVIDDVVQELRHDQGKLFDLSFRSGARFSCWRGYQAIYEIAEEKMFLNAVVACGAATQFLQGDTTVFLDSLYTDIIEYQNGRWIKSANTTITIGNSSNLVRWDGVFDRVFQSEKIIRIKNGRVIESVDVINYIDDPDRLNRGLGDTIHQILFERIIRLDWVELSDLECADGDTYVVTIDSRGRVKAISFADYETNELDDYWENKMYKKCFTHLKKALKELRFDEVYWHGQRFDDRIYLTLWYEGGKLENWSD
ncbi:hypothetical protein [Lewinella sp. JB7]|uniref:hypothetical protein n=1 Tax=Lewinella sp. JB7 TaxID=2962887 RepID=UPI0020C97299|nr:hypothetical protein [Lewinella sp. JB7]MCP9237527.1 hypothetical protein [Lewinella sp. JB7]